MKRISTAVFLGCFLCAFLLFGCQAKAADDTIYPQVTIEMDNGQKIVMELYPDIAPNTVNNFLELAQAGFYDGLVFHRTVPGFVIQGGDPEGNGSGGPGYSIKGEFKDNGVNNNLSHTRGVVSMARSPILDSAGSQFFIVVNDATSLDNYYAAFGRVISGMDEVDAIVSGPRNDDNIALEPRVMKKMTVETFGVEYPESVKLP